MKSLLAMARALVVAPVWAVWASYRMAVLNGVESMRIQKGAGCVIDPLVWIQMGQSIQLGSNVKISLFSSLLAGKQGTITIGDNSIIGPNCSVIAMNHGMDLNSTPFRYQPWRDTAESSVVVGENVWLGAHCIVLPGSRIADNCIIAAGTVVRGQVSRGVILANKTNVSGLTESPL
jgi:acetyltransferase-like isoleucine patch superfamily enzyme